jgi:hypothetical protein
MSLATLTKTTKASKLWSIFPQLNQYDTQSVKVIVVFDQQKTKKAKQSVYKKERVDSVLKASDDAKQSNKSFNSVEDLFADFLAN